MTKTVPLLAAVALCLSQTGFAAKEESPLKYTPELIKRGHITLYEQGALQVPYTKVKLIPAGPKPLEVAGELMGLRARQAFTTSLENAASSVQLIPAGTRWSVEAAKKITGATGAWAKEVSTTGTNSGVLIADASIDFGADMVTHSWQWGVKAGEVTGDMGEWIEKAGKESAQSVRETMRDSALDTARGGWRTGDEIVRKTHERAGERMLYAGNTFIKGYATLPEKTAERVKEIGEVAAPEHFAEAWRDSSEKRAKYAGYFTDLMAETIDEYGEKVGEDFRRAREALSDQSDYGVSLSLLKSMRWALQGLLWDGLVVPVSKMTVASVGYLGVNLVAFPVMVVVEEGVAVTKVAVQVTWNSAETAYDIVAPTATAAVAGIYTVFEVAGGDLLAIGTGLGGNVLGAGQLVAGEAGGAVLEGGGLVAGRTVQYVGVPLAATGVTLGSGTVGVVAGSAGAITGGTMVVASKGTAATGRAFGNIIGGTTVAVGATTSVAAAGVVGVYELSKAVIVPTGYELAGGVVLGYGAISHLSAHALLAVADASYLVLSLEGPRWVLYAVKGNLGDGSDLPPGTVLDLEAMQEAGEEIIYLPISDEEMQTLVEATYGSLAHREDVFLRFEGEEF